MHVHVYTRTTVYVHVVIILLQILDSLWLTLRFDGLAGEEAIQKLPYMG